MKKEELIIYFKGMIAEKSTENASESLRKVNELKNLEKMISDYEIGVYIEVKKLFVKESDFFTVFFCGFCLSEYPDIEIDISTILNISKKTDRKKNWQIEFDATDKDDRNILINSIMLGNIPSMAFRFFLDIEFLDVIFPELASAAGMTQNRYHIHDVLNHLLASIDAVEEKDIVLRWAALLHDIGKTRTRKEKKNGEYSFYNHEIESARMTPPIMKRFGIKKETGLKIKFLVRNHMFHYTDEWTDKAIRRFMKKIPKESMKDLILLRLADRKGSGRSDYFPPAIKRLLSHIEEVQKKDDAFKVTDLAINGHDLMKSGIPPGPQMGNILNHLKDMVEAKKLKNDKDILLPFALEYFQSIKENANLSRSL